MKCLLALWLICTPALISAINLRAHTSTRGLSRAGQDGDDGEECCNSDSEIPKNEVTKGFLTERATHSVDISETIGRVSSSLVHHVPSECPNPTLHTRRRRRGF